MTCSPTATCSAARSRPTNPPEKDDDMTTTPNTTNLSDLVYGDWEWDEQADRPANIYPARITGRWASGVEFATDRATAETHRRGADRHTRQPSPPRIATRSLGGPHDGDARRRPVSSTATSPTPTACIATASDGSGRSGPTDHHHRRRRRRLRRPRRRRIVEWTRPSAHGTEHRRRRRAALAA